MKCKIHPDQNLIPAIQRSIKSCIVLPEKLKGWEYICPKCRESHFDACQKEYGHKFPSE